MSSGSYLARRNTFLCEKTIEKTVDSDPIKTIPVDYDIVENSTDDESKSAGIETQED